MSLTYSPEQQALRDVVLSVAPAYAIHPATWRSTITSGNGVTGDTTTSTGATYTVYVMKGKPAGLSLSLPGVEVGPAKWLGYNFDGNPPPVGAVLTNTGDASYVFTVADVDTDQGYAELVLEQGGNG